MTHKKNRKFHIVSIILSVILIIGIFPLAVSAAGCENCGEESGYTVAYEYWTSTYHSVRHWCNNCGKDQTMGGAAEEHSYSHSSSGYDVCVCGHSVACSCGGEGGESSCNHRNTYTYWEGCEWYTQCSSCDAYMGSGVSHSEYEYGEWEAYNGITHRRIYACQRCGEGEYEYEDHSFSFGVWQDENDYEHERYYCCELCYYDSIEYAAHEYTNKYYVDSEYEHIKVYECWCGHRYDEYELHNDTNGDGKCDMCGYMNKRFSVTVPAFLTTVMGNYEFCTCSG